MDDKASTIDQSNTHFIEPYCNIHDIWFQVIDSKALQETVTIICKEGFYIAPSEFTVPSSLALGFKSD